MGLKPRLARSSDGFSIGQAYRVALDAGGWSAFQIIDLGDEQIEIVELDLLLHRPPAIADVATAKPLVLTHHAWKNRLERLWVSRGPLPANIELIGECPLVYRPTEKGRSYGGMRSIGRQVRRQRYWDELPAEVIQGYRLACSADPGERVSIALGAESVPIWPGTVELRVGPSDAPLTGSPQGSTMSCRGQH